MDIPLLCWKCITETPDRGVVFAVGEIGDSGVHVGSCPFQHQVRYWTPKPAHELLFDVGGKALLDGYFREAVSSFAATLEQAFEYYVEVSCLAAGIAHGEVTKLLRSNRRDQRRAGMVSVSYLRDTGQDFPFLVPRWVEFRNNVIHNAAWPTRMKTLEYGDFVAKTVGALYQTLGEKKVAYDEKRRSDHDVAIAVDLQAGREPVQVLENATLLDFARGAATFEEALDTFARAGQWSWPRRPQLVG